MNPAKDPSGQTPKRRRIDMVAIARHHANLRKEYLKNVSEIPSEDEETKYNSRARADRQVKREELIMRNRMNALLNEIEKERRLTASSLIND